MKFLKRKRFCVTVAVTSLTLLVWTLSVGRVSKGRGALPSGSSGAHALNTLSPTLKTLTSAYSAKRHPETVKRLTPKGHTDTPNRHSETLKGLTLRGQTDTANRHSETLKGLLTPRRLTDTENRHSETLKGLRTPRRLTDTENRHSETLKGLTLKGYIDTGNRHVGTSLGFSYGEVTRRHSDRASGGGGDTLSRHSEKRYIPRRGKKTSENSTQNLHIIVFSEEKDRLGNSGRNQHGRKRTKDVAAEPLSTDNALTVVHDNSKTTSEFVLRKHASFDKNDKGANVDNPIETQHESAKHNSKEDRLGDSLDNVLVSVHNLGDVVRNPRDYVPNLDDSITSLRDSVPISEDTVLSSGDYVLKSEDSVPKSGDSVPDSGDSVPISGDSVPKTHVSSDGGEATSTSPKEAREATNTSLKEAREATSTSLKEAREATNTSLKEAREATNTSPKEAREATNTSLKEAREATSTSLKETREATSTSLKEAREATSTSLKEAMEATNTSPKEAREATSTSPKETREATSTAPKEAREATSTAPKDAGERQKALIVVHQKPWFVHSTEVDFSACQHSTCTLSYNRSLLARASAVVFDALSLSPSHPPRHPPGQLWVLFFMEPPPVLRYHDPSFQHPEWRGVFNLTMSYRYDSDIFTPYGIVHPQSTTYPKSPSPDREASASIRDSVDKTGRETGNVWHDIIFQKKSSSLQENSRYYKNPSEQKRTGSVFNPDTFGRQPQSSMGHKPNGKDKQTLNNYDSRADEEEAHKDKPQELERVLPDTKHKASDKEFYGGRKPYRRGTEPETNSRLPTNNPQRMDSLTAPLSTPGQEALRVTAMKTRSAVWLVSHCGADSARDQYVRRLQRHLDVDVYGKCSGRRCGGEAECRALINATYRFLLSFENSFCRDYVTEKVFNAYSSDFYVIPVVRGGADYSRILPPGTYVDASDFPSPEALAGFLSDLSKDHVTYALMLERKNMHRAEQWQWLWPSPWCQLCQALHDPHRRVPGSSVYPDVADWIARHACWAAPDLS